jgi:hypothetical protein
MTPTVLPSNEVSCSLVSLSGTDSVETTPLVLDAGADDDLAAHGRGGDDDMVMVWAAQSVEQDAGNPAMVRLGAAGVTASASPMAEASVAGSAGPADARARSALLELAPGAVTQGAVTTARVMGTAGATTSGVVVAGAGGGGSARPVSGRRRSSHILSRMSLISALHSSR